MEGIQPPTPEAAAVSQTRPREVEGGGVEQRESYQRQERDRERYREQETGTEGEREREKGEGEGARERERKVKRKVCVCVCVCTCMATRAAGMISSTLMDERSDRDIWRYEDFSGVPQRDSCLPERPALRKGRDDRDSPSFTTSSSIMAGMLWPTRRNLEHGAANHRSAFNGETQGALPQTCA